MTIQNICDSEIQCLKINVKDNRWKLHDKQWKLTKINLQKETILKIVLLKM